MTDTTVERVRAIASHLADLTDAAVEMFIEDAQNELTDYEYDETDEEKLQRYLAAHFATISERRANSYSVGDISVSYNATSQEGLMSTDFGQEFLRVLGKSKPFLIKVL